MFHIPLNFLSRKKWEALPPKSVEPLSCPVDYVIFDFTGTKECFTKEECQELLREMQIQDMENGLPDIRFNFLLGHDGTVYEGRGWTTNNFKTHPHYREVNGKSIDFAYIGPHPVPYQRNYPRLLVNLTHQKLIEYGIDNFYIYSMYNLSHYTEESNLCRIKDDRHFVVPTLDQLSNIRKMLNIPEGSSSKPKAE